MFQLLRISGAVLCLTMSGMAAAAAAGPGILHGFNSIKITVKDFKTSTDYYVKYFGMKEGQRYNSHEQGIDWPKPGHGSSIVLLHDDTGQLNLPNATAFIVMTVSDARKLAKKMTDDGIKDVGEVRDVEQFHISVFMTKDPDGNQIEVIQFKSPAAK